METYLNGSLIELTIDEQINCYAGDAYQLGLEHGRQFRKALENVLLFLPFLKI
jgi:hypothetical protein